MIDKKREDIRVNMRKSDIQKQFYEARQRFIKAPMQPEAPTAELTHLNK